MRNYINSLKANEKKGFSLVELIIVIAIMAILVGVVAATVIPYLEKSRKAKDQQQISDINTSLRMPQ
jgi:type IV pilus assembly protein PilA